MVDLATVSTKQDFQEKLKAISKKASSLDGSTQEIESPYLQNEDDCYNINLTNISQFDWG